MFIALYMPANVKKLYTENPTRRGFDSPEAAWNYVYTMMCQRCKDERTLALTDSAEAHNRHASRHPACACEFEVCLESEFDLKDLKKFKVYAN